MTARAALGPERLAAFKVTIPVPPVALSVIVAPLPAAPTTVKVVAFVEAATAPVLPLRLTVGALSEPPVTETPLAPLN